VEKEVAATKKEAKIAAKIFFFFIKEQKHSS
jgi:hypothetical protein